jgi:Lar family restriction alleviation protein
LISVDEIRRTKCQTLKRRTKRNHRRYIPATLKDIVIIKLWEAWGLPVGMMIFARINCHLSLKQWRLPMSQNNIEAEIKSCPFCGCNPRFEAVKDKEMLFKIKCPDCPSGMEFYSTKTKEECIDRWNTRHSEKKELDEKELKTVYVYCRNNFNNNHEDTKGLTFVDYLSKTICAKFSAPSSKVVSVEDIRQRTEGK